MFCWCSLDWEWFTVQCFHNALNQLILRHEYSVFRRVTSNVNSKKPGDVIFNVQNSYLHHTTVWVLTSTLTQAAQQVCSYCAGLNILFTPARRFVVKKSSWTQGKDQAICTQVFLWVDKEMTSPCSGVSIWQLPSILKFGIKRKDRQSHTYIWLKSFGTWLLECTTRGWIHWNWQLESHRRHWSSSFWALVLVWFVSSETKTRAISFVKAWRSDTHLPAPSPQVQYKWTTHI